jgi:hypothetical protein
MIINNLNMLGEAYLILRSIRMVQSKAEFSERYLGKAPSYLSCMQARARQVPNPVIAMLEWSLQRDVVSFESNPHLGLQHAVRLNAVHARLVELHHVVRRHRASLARFKLMAHDSDAGPHRRPPVGPSANALAVEPESPLGDILAQGRNANGGL